MSEIDLEAKCLPPVSLLWERLHYNEETGVLTWLPRAKALFKNSHHHAAWVSRCQGKEAGVVVMKKHKKYRRVSICGVPLYAHRIAWAMHSGFYPVDEIDHINGNSLDNSIANLRLVSRQENCQNVKLHANSASGYCGVNWHEETGKWRARVKLNGKEKYIGLFDDPAEAAIRIKQLRDSLGFHEDHGRPIKTPEQIAEEDRTNEIKQMCRSVEPQITKHNMDIACSAAIRATIEELYDQGYRRIEK